MCHVKGYKQYIIPEYTCIHIYLICIFFYAMQCKKVKTLTQGYYRSVRDSHVSHLCRVLHLCRQGV